MPERVRITDVSPRDGLQNEPGVIPTADKVRLIELLCGTGVDEIEVTSFVSAKWVPQLGDAKELLRRFREPLPEGGAGVGSLGPRAPEPDGSSGSRWEGPARQRRTMGMASSLRKAMTGPEQELWALLKDRSLMGVKFRRQHPFGPYVLDFFCHELKLAVEVDGRTHSHPSAQQHDTERDEWISSRGVAVMRVSNDAVLVDPVGVALHIRDFVRPLAIAGRAKPTPAPPSGRGSRWPMLSALVPNIQGLQGVLDANRDDFRRLISKVSVFTAASETFSKKNINATIAESLNRFRPVIQSAHAEGLIVRAYISCAIACPFEGSTPPERVAALSRQLFDLGADEIDLGDTIGAGTPEAVTALLRGYQKQLPIRGARVPLTLHLHDTFNRAADCVKAALDLGVRSFDGSVAGLGGCPYASRTLPDGTIQRAPGNISTELLVRTVHDAGYETGVDLDALARAAEFARNIVARAREGNSRRGAEHAGGTKEP